VVAVSSILRRLAREDRGRAVLVRNVDVSHDGHPSDLWGEEALYVYHERLGIGDGLGMDEDAARAVAFREAQGGHLRETRSKP
jgi:hypothetical protein